MLIKPLNYDELLWVSCSCCVIVQIEKPVSAVEKPLQNIIQLWVRLEKLILCLNSKMWSTHDLDKGKERKKWEKSVCWRSARCGQTQEVRLEFQQCRQSFDSLLRCSHFSSQSCLCRRRQLGGSLVAVNQFQPLLCIVNPGQCVNDRRKTVSRSGR